MDLAYSTPCGRSRRARYPPVVPNFEPFSNAECRALVLAERLDRAGEPLTNSDGVKLVTVTKLVHRGLMKGVNSRDDGLGWPSRITDERRVVARALAWWSTPADADPEHSS